jgi:murein DD-endopeptidase MepM/ murein hydrolase activator NlpD
MKPPRLGAATVLAALTAIAALAALPILGLGTNGTSLGCRSGSARDDRSPGVLGTPLLSVADQRAWWKRAVGGQPARLGIAIGDLIALYHSEGDAEGVRGDIAFTQALLETGRFTSSGTSVSNFAGIAHFDGASAGDEFPDPVIGVRAHVQLLKKYAAGNDALLANGDVSPDAGASATTWQDLAGTWASNPNYWTSLHAIYRSMSSSSPSASQGREPSDQTEVPPCAVHHLAVDGVYSLPVDRRWFDEHPDRFARPHHDYPAVDIALPLGTPLYALTSGVVVAAPTSGRCGVGLVFNGDDGAQYTYCHGGPGTPTVEVGDRITVGQYLLNSASTGNSTGPHLHLAIEAGGLKRCPQPLLRSIVEHRPLAPHRLPIRGCVS